MHETIADNRITPTHTRLLPLARLGVTRAWGFHFVRREVVTMNVSTMRAADATGPPDTSWATERAEAEFRSGYLSGEFDEEIVGGECEVLQEVYGYMHERFGNGDWLPVPHWMQLHAPLLTRRAREAVVQARAEQIIAEGGR